tara:strand:+ start:122 stop:424 length:303 start_codon:yes stop_codon:yes gene_type:complete
MSDNKEPNDFLSELPEGERIELENELMEQAFENSYKIVTKRTTLEELAKIKSMSTINSILLFDPTEKVEKEVIEDLIWHFEDREEYEKCAELKKILDVQL